MDFQTLRGAKVLYTSTELHFLNIQVVPLHLANLKQAMVSGLANGNLILYTSYLQSHSVKLMIACINYLASPLH